MNSIKSRMRVFYFSDGCITMVLCILAFSLNFYLTKRYEQAINQISVFYEFQNKLTSASSNAQHYYQTEIDAYVEQLYQNIASANNNLSKLKSQSSNVLLQREYQDTTEMLSTIISAVNTLKDIMHNYKIGNLTEYQVVPSEYTRLQNIFAAINDRYETIEFMLLDKAHETSRLLRSQQIFFVVLFALFASAGLIAMYLQIRLISLKITDPLHQLSAAAFEMQKTEISENSLKAVCISSQPDAEITMLISVFNSLLDKVRLQFTTLRENAAIREELEKSHFKELQMQINPHFMFNTLNMIAEKAYLEGADDTVELLEKAAGMFRYSLDFSSKAVPLQKEMEQLDRYVFIQENRYGERIRFLFDLDESHHNIKIPALTLQPLVENAIVHGVALFTKQGLIQISTCYNEADCQLLIEIKDNGEGMKPEKLEEVRNMMHNYKGSSLKIGVGNVYMRLNNFYNGKSKMNIYSTYKKGTVVRLALPYEREVQDV